MSSNLNQLLEEIRAMRQIAEYCKQGQGLQEFYEAHTSAGYEDINPDIIPNLTPEQRIIYRVALNLMKELDLTSAIAFYPKQRSSKTRVPIPLALEQMIDILDQNTKLGYAQTVTEKLARDYAITYQIGDQIDNSSTVLKEKIPPLVKSIADFFVKIEADFAGTL